MNNKIALICSKKFFFCSCVCVYLNFLHFTSIDIVFVCFILVFLLFNRLFEEHGELLGLFSKFRELKTKEQQASSEELAEHANKVMETIDEGIRSLDDLDTFFEYLHQVGASHTRIPDFKPDFFWVSFISC